MNIYVSHATTRGGNMWRPTGFAGSGQQFFNITYIPSGAWAAMHTYDKAIRLVGGRVRGRPCAFFLLLSRRYI